MLKVWNNCENNVTMLLLLLSRFSRVRLCATPETAAHQAPPSLGFSRQEHWSRLPFPSPMHESEKWKWSRSVMSDSSDPMDYSPPGSSIQGIFQAKVLEWGAIAFCNWAMVNIYHDVMYRRCPTWWFMCILDHGHHDKVNTSITSQSDLLVCVHKPVIFYSLF